MGGLCASQAHAGKEEVTAHEISPAFGVGG